MVTPVYLEVGAKRTFACSVDWPGWCRSGKDDDAALEALAAYTDRYAAVVAAAGLTFATPGGVRVVERVKGNGTTDFGAPGVVPAVDARPVRPKDAERAAALLVASWQALERAAAAAPAVLPKGPRGGGRDRDAIVAHVAEAERAYARKIGVRLPPRTDPREVRDAVRQVLGSRSDGAPLVERGWPARYAARRIAWHALDHAWELEDKSG